jgi:hypothetical protein
LEIHLHQFWLLLPFSILLPGLLLPGFLLPSLLLLLVLLLLLLTMHRMSADLIQAGTDFTGIYVKCDDNIAQ